MNRYFLFLCMLLSTLLLVSSAAALSVTVDDNITDNLYMASGSTVEGSFDIKPELLPSELYNAPYDIESGSYNFTFSDDYDRQYNRTYYTAWSGHDNNNRDETFYRTEYNLFNDSAENVVLEVSGSQYENGTSSYSTSRYIGTSITTDSDYWWIFHLDTDTYVTYRYIETSGYGGEFTITNALTELDLATLSAGGTLDFSLTANGDLYFSSGQLNVEVNANPVPEPATLLLLGSGILGLGGIRRKSKKQ